MSRTGAGALRALDVATQQELIATSHQLADIARGETLAYFRKSGLGIEDKGGTDARPDFDPVTVADRAAEAAMRAHIEASRPDDGILGEEFGEKPGTSGLTWVLDPIDGTRGYVSGTPTWGVLISVALDGVPVLGVIDQPYIGERFVGGFGVSEVTGPTGTTALATRPARALSEATVLTTFPEVGSQLERDAFHAVAGQAQLTRYGMDCYGYALIAAGTVDLVIEAGLAPYDIQAPIAVVEAAGGIVTDWQGGPAHAGGRAIAAANGEIHAEALQILKAYDG